MKWVDNIVAIEFGCGRDRRGEDAVAVVVRLMMSGCGSPKFVLAYGQGDGRARLDLTEEETVERRAA
jgi:hypothetical protein